MVRVSDFKTADCFFNQLKTSGVSKAGTKMNTILSIILIIFF